MSTKGSELRGLTALVAEGGRGIGREVALNLGARGARVAIVSRSRSQADKASRAIEEAGGVAWPFLADVTAIGTVPDLVSKVGWRLGSADILVCCAALAGPPPPAAAEEDREPCGAPSLKTRAMLALAAGVLPGMLDRGWGRIVSVLGEREARRSPVTGDTAVGASATAVETAVAALAVELEGTGVTANAYRPVRSDKTQEPGGGRTPHTAHWAQALIACISGDHNGTVCELAGGGLAQAGSRPVSR